VQSNFTKQTGEVCMSITFEGSGLPEGSTAFKTHNARLHPAANASSPQPTIAQSSPVVYPDAVRPPVATIAPPVMQQQYQSQAPPQPQYQQPPPQQQYQSQAPMYQSQAPVQQQQYVQQPQYSQPPPQPMYQQPPGEKQIRTSGC
jgi:hypothetical protein